MRDTDAPKHTEVPFRYTHNPAYLSLAMIDAGIAVLRNAFVGLPPLAVGGVCDPSRSDRARGTVSVTHLRRGVPSLQGDGATLGIVSHPDFRELHTYRTLGE
jgi:hypothetical protein